MTLENKTAIVTGGSRGIGRAICVALAQAGANVVTCYAHGAAGAEETVKLCEAYGVKASAIQADVAKNEDVQALVAKVKEEYGSIDILVNNAGITKDNLMLKMTEEDFEQVIDTNLRVHFCASSMYRRLCSSRSADISSTSAAWSVSVEMPDRSTTHPARQD